MDLPRYIRVAERANLIEKNDLINQPENSPPLSKKVVHVIQYFPKKVTEMGIWWNTFYILLFFYALRPLSDRYAVRHSDKRVCPGENGDDRR